MANISRKMKRSTGRNLCAKSDRACQERNRNVHQVCFDIEAPFFVEEIKDCSAYGDAGACTEAVECASDARQRFRERTYNCIKYA